MLKNIIEYKRNELYQTIGLSGLNSQETLAISQELERFINYHHKVSMNMNIKSDDANVHANAIKNILEVANKEKLQLPFEITDGLLKKSEWFRINVVHTLLHAIAERYGTEVVEYIGECVPVHCIFPQNVQTFKESLQHLDFIFHLNHKSPIYIGEYLPFMDIKNETVLFCFTPHYSSAFNYGIIKGLSKKFNHSLNIKILDSSNGGQFKIVT